MTHLSSDTTTVIRKVKRIPIKHYQEIKTANVYLFSNQHVEWVDIKGTNTPYKVTIIKGEI